MRKPQGYAVWNGPGGVEKEMDTFTCHHCLMVVFVPPKADPSQLGGFCMLCMKNICGPCADKGSCTPWEKEMERQEAKSRFLKSAGLE